MSDITERIKNSEEGETIRNIMYSTLMTHGTLYDGKERSSELVQDTLATGDLQNALQLGSIIKGDFHRTHDVSGMKGHWIIHTHGKRNGQKLHPPSLQDVLLTIQRSANDSSFRGISIIVAKEGFYIMYPSRGLIDTLTQTPGSDAVLGDKIKKKYPAVFTSACTSGDVQALVDTLKSYNIICEFIHHEENSSSTV
jgi:hypothetical protein